MNMHEAMFNNAIRSFPGFADLGEGLSPVETSGAGLQDAFVAPPETADPTDLILGQGYDPISCTHKRQIVDYGLDKAEVASVGGEEAATTEFRLVSVEKVSEYYETLGISASASLKLGIFGGSAEAEFGSQRKLNSYSLSLVVQCSSIFAPRILKSRTANDEGIAAAQEGDPIAFYEGFGLSWARREVRGAIFAGVLTIETLNAEDRRSLKTKVEASAGPFGSASGAFSQTLDEIQKSRTVSFKQVRAGGGGPLPEGDHIVEYAQAFAGNANYDNSPVLFYRLDSYENAKWPPGVTPPNLDVLLPLLRKLKAVSLAREDALSLAGDFEYALTHRDEFPKYSQDQLNDGLQSAETEIQRLGAEYQTILANPYHPFSGQNPLPESPDRTGAWITIPLQSPQGVYIGKVPSGEIKKIASRGWWHNANFQPDRIFDANGRDDGRHDLRWLAVPENTVGVIRGSYRQSVDLLIPAENSALHVYAMVDDDLEGYYDNEPVGLPLAARLEPHPLP